MKAKVRPSLNEIALCPMDNREAGQCFDKILFWLKYCGVRMNQNGGKRGITLDYKSIDQRYVPTALWQILTWAECGKLATEKAK